jgi:3-phytase/alkaline phosphatase D
MQDTRAERYTNPLAAIAAIMASLAIALAVLALAPRMVAAQDAPATPLRLLGEFIYPYGTTFQGLPVGELSGITYDQRRGVYYAVADERSMARFYTLAIDLGPQGIRDVRVTGMTLLDSDAAAPGIQPHERDDSDLEEIVLLPNGDLLISSERDRNNVPWIRRYRLDGTLLSELPLPAKFLPAADRGVRRNLAFEAMTASPDGATLLVANEQALAQDGPLATPDHGTNVRVLRYDLRGAPRPGSELVYVTERIFARPEPPGADADNGVTALLWVRHLLPPFDALALERSFVTGTGNGVRIFGITLAGAEDVSGLEALPFPFTGRTVTKTLLLDLRTAGILPDNLEAMTLGPRLPNGNPTLIVVSDDNLRETQRNQVLLFEIDVRRGLPRTGSGPDWLLPAGGTAVAAVLAGLGLRRAGRHRMARRSLGWRGLRRAM